MALLRIKIDCDLDLFDGDLHKGLLFEALSDVAKVKRDETQANEIDLYNERGDYIGSATVEDA